MNAIAARPDENLQLSLELLYDKNQLMPRVRAEFIDCKDFNFIHYCEEQGIPSDFGIDLLAHMAIRKRANVPTLVGCLWHHFKDSQTTADFLQRAAEADLVDLHQVQSPYDNELKWEFVVKFGISDDVQRELDKFQYPLPMVIQPRKVESNLDSGYLNRKESVILRDNHHNDDVCLDHINRMNAIPFAINMTVAKAIQNKWKGIDKRKKDETWEDYRKRRKAFDKYNAVAKDVLALLTKQGNRIYLTHKYDKRGRTYCMGFHVTYQGTDWNKSVLELADKEYVLDE